MDIFRPSSPKNPDNFCDGQVPDGPIYYQPPYGLGSLDFARLIFYAFDDKWVHSVPQPDYPDRWEASFSEYDEAGSMTDPAPPVTLSEDELSLVTDSGIVLDTYILEETQKFIEGQRPLNDDEWADFTATVESLGAHEVEDAWNAALGRFKAEVGE